MAETFVRVAQDVALAADPGAQNGHAQPWPALKSLERHPPAPEFPVDALPAVLAEWVDATSRATQTPAALAAGMGLCAASAAALGSGIVVCAEGWEEELALFIVPVLASGERKSAVVKSATAPLRAVERERLEEARTVIAQAQAERDALDARRQQLVRDVGKGKGDVDELQEVIERQAALQEPVAPRLLADDATPEALAGLLAQHGQLGILAAESALFDNLTGRYSDNSQPNVHLACQAYNGEETRIDRRNRPAEHLPRPLLSLGLAVQPHVLEALTRNAVLSGQGFLARVVFLVPETKLGRRDLDPPAVPAAVHAEYRDMLRRLAERNRTDTTQPDGDSVGSVAPSGRLVLGDAAAKAFRAFRREHEPRLDPAHGDLAPIGAWAAKHPGRVARLAGLHHLIDGVTGRAISGEAMHAAIRIGECLIEHAQAALLSHEHERRRFERAVAWVATVPSGRFSVRELHRGPLGAHGQVDDAHALADELEERGYIRPLPAPPTGQPGRPPSRRYEVNPAARDEREP